MACTHPRLGVSTLPVEDHPKAAFLARFSLCKEKIFKYWCVRAHWGHEESFIPKTWSLSISQEELSDRPG